MRWLAITATAAIGVAGAVSVTGARGAATVRPAPVVYAAPVDGAERRPDQVRQPAAARPDQVGDLRIVGQLGGDVRAVARLGDWAVIGLGPRVAVVDIADPTTTRLLGQTGLLAGTVIDVEVQGTLAYAIAGGLSVVDLADPSAPREIGYAAVGARGSLYGWTGPSRLAVGDGVVAMIGHSVYRFGRPLFVDVTDPTSPAPVSELELDGGTDVAMDGRVAYIGTCEGTRCRGAGRGLLAFDLADPAAPRLIGELTAPGMVWRVALAGPHVVVLSSQCQAGLIDVSDPTAMSLRVCRGRWDNHSRTPDDNLVDLAFDGATLTVADEYGGWHALDPTAALTTAIGYAHVASGAYGVAWTDGWAFVAAGPDGLRIVDARHLADPHLLGELDLDDVAPLRERAIAGTERRLYVSASGPENRGLTIVDVSDPASPRRMGTVPVAARHIAPLGDHYLVADDEAVLYAGLRIVDVTDPAHAVDVATLPLSATVSALTVAGSSVYVAERRGLTVVDVADPTQPIMAVQVPLLFGANDVAVLGDVAYVAGDALYVVDLSDLPRPVIRAELGDPDTQTRHVAVDGDRMFMTGDARDLWAFDVTNPLQPRELWRVHTPYPSGYPVDLLAVRDGRLYMAGEGGGVWVFDVTGPALRLVSTVAPLLGGTWWVGQAQQAALAGGVTCVLDAYHPYHEAGSATPDPALPYHLRLRLFDLADDSDIRTVGVFGAGGGFRDVVADASIAYAADPSTGVHVVDTADPSAPVEIATVPLLAGALNMARRGDHLYVLAQRLVGERPRASAEYETALATIDVSDPAHPSLVGTTERPGMQDIAVIGDNLAVADDRGLFVFDIATDPARPRQIGHVGSSVSGMGYTFVAGAGRYALVVRRATTVGIGGPSPRRMPPILRVVDLARPESPQIVAEIPIGDAGTPASVRGLAVAGRYAYMAYGLDRQMNGALVVVDVADPTDPEVVGYWDSAEPGLPVVPVEPSGVDGDLRTAFLGSYAGIRALDMTVPGFPLEMARLDTPDEGLYRRLGMAVRPDGMLLLARGDAGLVVAGADLPTRETPTAGPSPTRTASATPLPTLTRLPTNTPTLRVWPTRGPTRTPTPWPTDLAWTATAAARTATIEALTRTPVPTDLPWTSTLAARTATAAARTAAAPRTPGSVTATGTPGTGTPGTGTPGIGTPGTGTPGTGTPRATGTPTGTTDTPARVWLPMLLDRG